MKKWKMRAEEKMNFNADQIVLLPFQTRDSFQLHTLEMMAMELSSPRLTANYWSAEE